MIATPPQPRKAPVSIEQVGRTRTDPFAWMKDDNWRAVMHDPATLRADIRAHLEAENAYTQASMADLEPLREKILAEMRGRIREDDGSVPAKDGEFEYFTRFEAGAQHPQYRRRGLSDGLDHLLIDAEAMAAGRPFFDLGAVEHAPDHRLIAYALDDQGSEVFKVFLRDTATGADLPNPIENVAFGSFAWSPCSRFVFWVWRDENGRPAKVYRREVRTGDDALIHAEADEGMFVGVGVSESRAFIFISIGNQETSETRFIPAADPTASPTVFAPRQTGQLYTPTHFDGRWLVLTNADASVDFKIMTCPLGATDREHWRDWLAHTPGRYIEGLQAFSDHLVRLERFDALPRLVVVDRETGEEHVIVQDDAAYDLSFVAGYEFETAMMRFAVESPASPRRWFDYDMRTRERMLRKTQEIPSGHDPARYDVQRFDVRADDGAAIPVTLLKLRDTPQDGSAPLLLYGYGSYGISMEAGFSIRRLSLVDRGWIWAIAHVRGGAERGRGWFEDGRKAKKRNTFTDFIAVAEALVAAKHTRPRRIVAYGGSAGGLLMGAVANMAPALWGGIIAAVPFVDALNTMSDASLPLTPPEWPEWGNPLESAEAYDQIRAWSPYDNVDDRPYPPVLATGGLSDPRVTYWEPAKWIAALRDTAPNGGPYFLKLNMDAGHAGASGRFESLKEIAFEFAFALRAVGETGSDFSAASDRAR